MKELSEEGEDLVKKGVELQTVELLEGKESKGKVEGLQQLGEQLGVVMEHLEIVLLYLKGRLKDWEDSNLTVNKEVVQLLQKVTGGQQMLDKGVETVVVGWVVTKLADTKFTEPNY